MSKFKVGDKVRIIESFYNFPPATVGNTAIVTQIGPDGTVWMIGSGVGAREHSTDDFTGEWNLSFYEEQVEAVEEPVVAKFKVGDKVRITHDTYKLLDRVGVVTNVNDGMWPAYMVGDSLGYEENNHVHENNGDKFHLFFYEEWLEPVEETKQMQVPFTITSNMISVFVDGKSFFVASTDGAFAELKEHLKGQHDVETIRNLVDKKAFITKITEGLVTVTDTEVLYKGQPVHSALTQKLLTLVAEGFDVRPWARFMDNLMQNPSYKSREALFKFLDKWMAPITEDGHFLAFKNVRSDFKDIHSGTFDNSPGTIVSMPREQVNDDSNETCSAGLHAAATSYLKHFYANGSRTVVVKINPRDVVAVPYDYDSAKMRVCQYEVLREVEQDEITRLEQQALTTSTGSWDDEYSSEMNTEEDTYYEDSYYNSYDEY